MVRTADIGDLLAAESVLPRLQVKSKNHLLKELARATAEQLGLNHREVYQPLLDRERLGSTGMGSGVALPHARAAGVERIHGLFARLAHPIEYEAPDDQRVDLVFMLLAPEERDAEHLKALARVSRLMRSEEVRAGLRGTVDAEAMYAILTGEKT